MRNSFVQPPQLLSSTTQRAPCLAPVGTKIHQTLRQLICGGNALGLLHDLNHQSQCLRIVGVAHQVLIDDRVCFLDVASVDQITSLDVEAVVYRCQLNNSAHGMNTCAPSLPIE